MFLGNICSITCYNYYLPQSEYILLDNWGIIHPTEQGSAIVRQAQRTIAAAWLVAWTIQKHLKEDPEYKNMHLEEIFKDSKYKLL